MGNSPYQWSFFAEKIMIWWADEMYEMMWETCQKPRIWGGLKNPTRDHPCMVLLGMFYGIGFITLATSEGEF